MKTSPAGRQFIEAQEGVRVKPYRDAVGIWTVGVGHTRCASVFHELGIELTLDQVGRLLELDLEPVELCINAHLARLTQNQFDAIASFAFNVGVGSFENSTLLRKLKAGDDAGAAEEFLRWTRAGGQVLAGLVKRREAERALFLKAS